MTITHLAVTAWGLGFKLVEALVQSRGSRAYTGSSQRSLYGHKLVYVSLGANDS